MVAGSRWLAAAACALAIGCEDTTPAPAADPDVVVLTTDAASTTFTDDAPGVSIYGAETLAGGLRLVLNVDAAPSRYFTVSFQPVPTSLPADVSGSFSYTIDGVTYTNTSAPLHLTRAEAMTFGHVAGSFADVVLTGPSASLTVSGSFDARVL